MPISIMRTIVQKKLNHVKLFHINEAYEFFIDRHISKGLREVGLCHVCKIAFSEIPRDHVSMKHEDRPSKELSKEKFE